MQFRSVCVLCSIFNGCCQHLYISERNERRYGLRMRLDGTQTERTRCHKFVTTTTATTPTMATKHIPTMLAMGRARVERSRSCGRTCALLYHPDTCTSRGNFISALRFSTMISRLLLDPSRSFCRPLFAVVRLGSSDVI